MVGTLTSEVFQTSKVLNRNADSLALHIMLQVESSHTFFCHFTEALRLLEQNTVTRFLEIPKIQAA